MLELKTQYGTFGNFRDLYRFMLEEDIENVRVTTYYIFDKLSTLNLSLQEIKNLAYSK
ncbi:hypothetical protein CLLI_22200 [Clostridium liquoris]|jgi:hypothetical protein|uniref:Uncharacterized protein n=1 Tax=Clostridium liquoris TaxID=1289519 RepID=A0A2T0B1R4_9CLOT|nr:hypothetical protein [Clostridium liquoris]PRR77656.1 hypothetical protein CLLI_22200 [Clostridium liquoris]